MDTWNVSKCALCFTLSTTVSKGSRSSPEPPRRSVGASSFLTGEARFCVAQHMLRQRRLFELSSQGSGDEWPPLSGKQRKRGPGSPLRINTYAEENLPRILKSPIQPPTSPPPPLPTRSAVSCITDRQASGRRWAGNVRTLRKQGE